MRRISGTRATWRTAYSWAVIAIVPAILVLMPLPAGATPASWRLLAVFIATILGLILQPLPIGAMALIGIVTAAGVGALTPAQALGGYADPLVWMVLAAFWIARGMIKTGLGRRIAYLFIGAAGRTSLGLGYALVGSDVALGTVIPSNGARAGGILFPIVRSLGEAYDTDSPRAIGSLGAFLVLVVYHCDMTVSALFLTGNAANPLIASLAGQTTGIELTYSRWALGAIAPAVASLCLVPLLMLRLMPPAVRSTPAAAAMAKAELRRLGPPATTEWLMLLVFGVVLVLWTTRRWHGIDYPIVALIGVAVLLIGRVLTWDELLAERGAWDVFVWYGAIYQMARVLGELGIARVFVQGAGNAPAGATWWPAFAALLIGYFYAHYFFASITARASAMFVPFLLGMVAAGTPPYLATLSLAYFSALAAALTHYGTTSSPIYFGAGYLTQGHWWRLGVIVATLNAAIWIAVGSIWWKLLGWW